MSKLQLSSSIIGGRDSANVQTSVAINTDNGSGHLAELSIQLRALQSEVNRVLSELVDKEKAVATDRNRVRTEEESGKKFVLCTS